MKSMIHGHVKKLIGILIALIVVAVAALGAYTYAFDLNPSTTTGITTIQSGKVKIELRESSVPEGGEAPVLGATPVQIRPGSVASKIYTIKNSGNVPAFVRVKYTPVFKLSEANADKTPDPSLVTCNVDTEAWELHDGYYYCKEPLLPGQESTPLFTTITFDYKMDNTYTNSTITFLMDAYAIPTDGQEAAAMFESGLWPLDD